MSPTQYNVSYNAVSRGQHKLYVQVNSIEIDGSPFFVTVYPDPAELGYPLRVVRDLNRPYGIAFNGRGEMIVSECWGNKVSLFNIRGEKFQTFGSHGEGLEQMVDPAGVANDNSNNVYVTSEHKLQKFTSSGKLIKCIGRKGSSSGEFHDPRGITVNNNRVYVCDCNNHRIQVFELDLKFLQSFGSLGKGKGEFNAPFDIKCDTAGNLYVAEYSNKTVQVLDSTGHFLRVFGQGKLRNPSGLCIADKFVYVSDNGGHCIVVFETSGLFVTWFGRHGEDKGEFNYPRCITSCFDGFIHVCDWYNDRVQIF